MYRVIDTKKIQGAFLIVSRNGRKDRAILAARKAYSNPNTPATLTVQRRGTMGGWINEETIQIGKAEEAASK